MELEIMNGVTSENFQSNDENIQLSLEKKNKVDQDFGELVFNGKNCSNMIPQLKPNQKSSDLVASCGPSSEEISLSSDSKSPKFVFIGSFNNSIIDKFGKSKKLQKLTSKKKDMENNKSVDTDTFESTTIGKKDVPNPVENTEDMTKFESPNEKENLRCHESIQKNKVYLGAKSQIDLEMKVDKDKQSETDEKLEQGKHNIKTCGSNGIEIPATKKECPNSKQCKKCYICEENIEMSKYSSHIKSCFYLCSKFLTNTNNGYQCKLCSANSTVRKDMYRHIREKHNLAAEQKTDVGTQEKLTFYSCKFCNEMINKNDFVEHIKKNHYGSVAKIQNNVTTRNNQKKELFEIDNSKNQNLVEKGSEIAFGATKTKFLEKQKFNYEEWKMKKQIYSNQMDVKKDELTSKETFNATKSKAEILEKQKSTYEEWKMEKQIYSNQRILQEPTQKISKDNSNVIDNLGDPMKEPIEQSNEIEISNDLVDSSEIGLDMTVEEENQIHGIVENKIDNEQIVDTNIDQQIEQSINMANQKHDIFENRIDEKIIETIEVGNYQQIELAGQSLMHIQDQLFKAQAIKCDMCSYFCSDLYSMEQHFSNVHIGKSQSINSEIEQSTDIVIENVTEDQAVMMSDDHNSDEITELDPLDISSPTAMENNDLMQDPPTNVQREDLVKQGQVQKGLTHMQIDQLIKNIQDQRFRAQALKCDMCSYICSDLYSMEQHLKNVHIEKSQFEQQTDIVIENLVDISSPTDLETNDIMQDQTTAAHVQESNVRKDHTQQGFQQGRIKIMVMPKDNIMNLQCNFCHKMFKKGEYAEHVKANHKSNDGLNEIVEQQRKG